MKPGVGLKTIAAHLLDTVFVPRCAVCGEVIEVGSSKALCAACGAKWERAKYRVCRLCGMPHHRCLCATQFMYDAGINVLLKLAEYDTASSSGIVNRIVYALKNQHNTRLMKAFAHESSSLLSDYLVTHNIDFSNVVITYLPRTKYSYNKAGYDQAGALAKFIGRELGIELKRDFVRHGGTLQKNLGSAARRENVERTLLPKEKLCVGGETIIMVDDVVTTGATMARAGRILREHGAQNIIALTITKAGRGSSGTFKDE